MRSTMANDFSEERRGRLPVCPQDEFCGGCTYQGIPYEEQLQKKDQEVQRLLDQMEIVPEIREFIEGCPESSRYAYRNKMEYTFGDFIKDGELTLGMHKIRNFMSIVTVDRCQLVDSDFNVILRYTLDFCIDRGYSKYHKKKHTGLLRNLVVRRGVRTGEILVNIVTTTEKNFCEDDWKDGLLKLDLAQNKIVGIMHTLNDQPADAVKCDSLHLLYGRDYYMEEIAGLQFKVNIFSFFQTNPEAAERLYLDALHLIDGLEGKTVFDLYCGTGTISQIAAQRAKATLGIELIPESVHSACANRELNHLENCEFFCGDVYQVLRDVTEKPDVIIVDPPRAGMSPDAVSKISSYGVPQIVYISCNPKSLVKNLVQFQNSGYAVKFFKPYDNYPFTSHVETVVLMSRVKD